MGRETEGRIRCENLSEKLMVKAPAYRNRKDSLKD